MVQEHCTLNGCEDSWEVPGHHEHSIWFIMSITFVNTPFPDVTIFQKLHRQTPTQSFMIAHIHAAVQVKTESDGFCLPGEHSVVEALGCTWRSAAELTEPSMRRWACFRLPARISSIKRDWLNTSTRWPPLTSSSRRASTKRVLHDAEAPARMKMPHAAGQQEYINKGHYSLYAPG